MRILLLLLLLIAFPNALFAQSDLLRPQKELIGTKIDEITITDYLKNEPKDKDFNDKFKVLEFWATWCSPCLKAVPHLNKMQRAFKDQNIVFLSITYQKPEETANVFKKFIFETIVVSDQTRTIHRKLKIENNGYMPLPRTVLVDNENNIVWYGSPRELNEEMIQKFLKKESLIK